MLVLLFVILSCGVAKPLEHAVSVALNVGENGSYALGPGLGPCLRTGATAARAFAYTNDIPLIGVNHCVAHLEIGLLEGAEIIRLSSSMANGLLMLFAVA